MKTPKAAVAFAIAIIALLIPTILAAGTPIAPNNLYASNTVTVKGSSTVYPVSLLAKPAFEAATGMTIDLPAPTGSGSGANALAAGTADIAAMSSFPGIAYWNASTSTGMDDLRVYAIGIDSLAIIVDQDNPFYSKIQNVSAQQVSDLFSTSTFNDGSNPLYTTWYQFITAIGGSTAGLPADQPIARHTRVLDSGTHDSFKVQFHSQVSVQYPDGVTRARNDSYLANHATWDANQQMLTAIEGDPYAVGYIGLGFLETTPPPGVKPMWIRNTSLGDWIEPTKAHVIDGTYARSSTAVIMRWLWYVVYGIPQTGSAGALESKFISFVKLHPEYIDQSGYIRMFRSDFAGAAMPVTDPSAPIHGTVPDQQLSVQDSIYFVNAWLDFHNPAKQLYNPYIDFNADGDETTIDKSFYINAYLGGV
jgi:ABC-type phosphate transport system substrate-binding protein